MKEVIFKCATITPLILGEAIAGKIELRPPPIKSAMRFWWRSMNAHRTLPDLINEERNIFGGGGENSLKSKFDIIVFNRDVTPSTYNYRQEPLTTICKIEKGSTTGIQYLLYTFLYLKNSSGQYFQPETEFTIRLIFHENNDTIHNKVIASFWLLIFLGNIGERSRRGCGSIYVTEIIDRYNLTHNFNFKDFTSQNYNNGIQFVKKLFNPHSIHLENNSYSHIYNTDILISNRTFNCWKESMEDIGTIMKNYRLHNKEKSIANDSGRLFVQNSAIFGLPVRHRDGSIVLPAEQYSKRASPIIIKIIRIENTQYKWIITRLEGDFMPNNNNNLISKKNGVRNSIPENANVDILNKFL